MRGWRVFLILGLLTGASQGASADVLDATPLEVGAGQYFEIDSAYNIVMRIPIVDSGTGDVLQSLSVMNNFSGQDAGNGSDIVPGSVRLWYVAAPDTGLNTATAQLAGVLTFFGGSWSNNSLNQAVQDGGALYVTVDILATATPDNICNFQVDTSMMSFQSGGSFPWLQSPLDPPPIYISSFYASARVEVGHQVSGPAIVSTGQTFTPLIFTVHNPNVDYPASNAPVALSGITLTVRDQAGLVIAPNRALEKIDLLVQDWKNNLWLFTSTSIPSSVEPVFIPMAVAVDADNDPTKSLRIEARVTVNANTATAIAKFRLELNQGNDLTACDALTFRPVPVVAAGGDSFAMQSSLVTVQEAARQVTVYHTRTMADNTVVIKGQTAVNPMDLTFTNPGTTATARIDVTQITLAVTDAAGTTIAPASVFSRVAISGGVLYGETTNIPGTGYLVTVPLSSSNISVLYQPVTVSVLVDILPEASAVNFRLSLAGPAAVRAQDANSQLPCQVLTQAGAEPFPMNSHVVRVASSFLVTGASIAPATLYPRHPAGMLQLTFAHPGPAAQGEIVLRGLTITALDQANQPVPIAGTIVEVCVRDSSGGLLALATVPTTGSTVYLTLPNVAVAPFASLSLRIEIRMADSPRESTFKLGIMASSQIEATLPLDPTRPVFVAGSWPILSQAAAVGGGEGQLRLSNYPNPFAAGRAMTRIAYYLEQSCNVWAVLYTLAGDEVLTLAQGEFQLPGEHLLAWNGRTTSGSVVANGVYLLRLEAVPTAAGDPVVQLRKIAVVK